MDISEMNPIDQLDIILQIFGYPLQERIKKVQVLWSEVLLLTSALLAQDDRLKTDPQKITNLLKKVESKKTEEIATEVESIIPKKIFIEAFQQATQVVMYDFFQENNSSLSPEQKEMMQLLAQQR